MNRETKARTVIPAGFTDVAFCLVIFFMVIALCSASVKNEAREKTLPPIDLDQLSESAESSMGAETLTVTLSVQPGPVYYWDEQAIAYPSLVERLKQESPPLVEIRGDVNARYGDVSRLLAQCEESGIRSVTMTFQSNNP
jgi:biopolymer transport protein ExbD